MHSAVPFGVGLNLIVPTEAGRRTIFDDILRSFLGGICSPSEVPEQMLLDDGSSGTY